MKPSQRQEEILKILDQQERATVEHLAEFFEVSHETVRRDLSTLYDRRLIRKVHGGAEKAQTASEASLEVRAQFNHEQKAAIAQAAAALVSPGDSLFINSGTTTVAFARALQQSGKLTLITNCSAVAHEIWQDDSSHKIYLLGGEYDGNFTDTYGSLTIEQVRLFQADHAFLTVGAVDASIGLMEYRVDTAHLTRAMIEQARYVTILADSSKLDQVALAKICALADIDRLITDARPPADLLEALEDAGVDLHIVS